MTGHEAAEFIADRTLLTRIMHADDRERYVEQLSQTLRTNQASKIDFRIIRPDGTERWIAHVCNQVLMQDLAEKVRAALDSR